MGVKFLTTRFGELDLPEERVILFPYGLIGLAGVRRFVLVDHPGGGPFQWLQAVDAPDLAFAVVDPRLFFRDYQVPVREEDLRTIGIHSVEEGVVVVILVVPRDPRGITANLLGPILINTRGRLGRQLVLEVPGYGARHPLFPEREGPDREEPGRDAGVEDFAASGREEASC